MDKETDKDREKESPAAGQVSPPQDAPKKYGFYGWVMLTDAQYDSLKKELGPSELERCIRYLDESAQSNANRNGWKDWQTVIRRCSRDRWGMAPIRLEKPTALQASCTLGKAEFEAIEQLLREEIP